MDGYAVRAADVATAPARLQLIGEVAAGHPFDRPVGAGEAARIFTGGVRAAGRRHHRDPGEHRARGRRRRGRRSRARRAATSAAPASTSPPATCCCGRPAPHRARPRARRRDEPPGRAGASPRPRSRCSRPATSWCCRATTPGPGQIVYSNGFALDGAVAAEGAEVIDLGIAPDRLDATIAAVRARARARRRHPGHHRRRLGRRPRPGAEGARGRGHGAVVLEDRAAARPAADARPARRHARARPARQSGLGLRLRASCSWCRCSAASPAAAISAPTPNRPCSAATCRPTTSAPTTCAPTSRVGADGSLVATPFAVQDSSMLAPARQGRLSGDSRAARARRRRPAARCRIVKLAF